MSKTIAAAPDPVTVDSAEAARLTGLSEATLKRASQRGEPTGRLTVGRRVVFNRRVLIEWLDAQATAAREVVTRA